MTGTDVYGGDLSNLGKITVPRGEGIGIEHLVREAGRPLLLINELVGNGSTAGAARHFLEYCDGVLPVLYTEISASEGYDPRVLRLITEAKDVAIRASTHSPEAFTKALNELTNTLWAASTYLSESARVHGNQ